MSSAAAVISVLKSENLQNLIAEAQLLLFSYIQHLPNTHPIPKRKYLQMQNPEFSLTPDLE